MRTVGGACALAAALALVSPDPAGASQPIATHRFTFAGDVDAGTVAAQRMANGDCDAPATTPVPDGEPIVVSLPPAAPFTVGAIDPSAWTHPLVSDPSWRLHFEGFMYLSPLAVRAHADGQLQSLATMVGQVVAFHEQNPDPGTSAYGWDEGTAQRRLAAENCLYALTRDPRLVPGMAADVQVQLGPRYYGPPFHAVHNHGLMANLRIVHTATLLGIGAWRSIALRRIASEAPLAFSAQGTSWEQSATYQAVDVGLWNEAADVLAANPGFGSIVATLRAVTAKGRRVVGWLTEPDGHLVQIGDSDRSQGVAMPGVAYAFRDDRAGYVVGRWSWTDPATTYYTLRYGPRRRAHGHFDRGALTWSTAGLRVLVGTGRYAYDTSAIARWQVSPAAQNVAIPATGLYRDNAYARVVSETVQWLAHAWRLEDDLYGRVHTRAVGINAGTHTLRVVDRFGGTGMFRQFWHLDPTWVLVRASADGRSLVFGQPTGHTLTITTTGRVSGVVRGSTAPVAGWSFPAMGVARPAYQVMIRSITSSVDTTFVVR